MRFAIKYQHQEQQLWNIVLWTDESKLEFFEHNSWYHDWHKNEFNILPESASQEYGLIRQKVEGEPLVGPLKWTCEEIYKLDARIPCYNFAWRNGQTFLQVNLRKR